MTRPLRSLRAHLLVSHLVTVVAVVVTLLVAVRLLVPRLFDDQVGGGNRGDGQGPPPQAGQFRDVVISSLNRALLVAAVAGLVVGVLLALLLARRLVRPVDRVRATTRALAGGDLDQRVERPSVAELAALADDVNVLADHLQHTEERRAHLVAELGHELRTPITTVQGYVEAFQDGVIEPSPEALAQLADEVRRMERLTADLALLSRLDEGQVALHLRQVDLGAAVRSVVARLGPQAEASGLTLVPSGADAVLVQADPDRLAQILTNLVGNAIRYSDPGGSIRIRWGADAAGTWCEVGDEGRGLAPDELATVFERFARGSASVGTAGSGVGLTIARSLVRAQGGELVAASDGPGRGATFTVRLPAPGAGGQSPGPGSRV